MENVKLAVSNDNKNKLLKLTQFNRVFAALIIFDLYLYTKHSLKIDNVITWTLLSLSWITLATYVFANETIIKNIKNKICEDSCISIAGVNALIATILVTTLILTTGNVQFATLFLIPIFNCQFFAGPKNSYLIVFWAIALLAFTDKTDWNQISVLIENQSVNIPSYIINGGSLFLLFTLGMIYSGYSHQQKEKSNKFHTLATIDGLTGIANRMEFNKNIVREFSRARRHNNKLSLAIFDIDFFKKINDTYGHIAGDIILKEIGSILKHETRDSDFVARYGGEEFTLILPETSLRNSSEFLERIREIIECHTFKVNGRKIDVTISIGVAEFSCIDKTAQELVKRADKALYKAKRNGRNRIEQASLSDGETPISYNLRAMNY